jgi:two-component system cell cycle response regulator CtrA
LILSDGGELDEKVKFLRFGADDFLTKPFDRRELVARILVLLRQ